MVGSDDPYFSEAMLVLGSVIHPGFAVLKSSLGGGFKDFIFTPT